MGKISDVASSKKKKKEKKHEARSQGNSIADSPPKYLKAKDLNKKIACAAETLRIHKPIIIKRCSLQLHRTVMNGESNPSFFLFLKKNNNSNYYCTDLQLQLLRAQCNRLTISHHCHGTRCTLDSSCFVSQPSPPKKKIWFSIKSF